MKSLKELFLFIVLGIIASGIYSCTDNERAKNYGGTMKINLPKGQKLETITFKESNVWYLTRPMLPTDSAVVHTFKEESTYGLMSGTILIYETK